MASEENQKTRLFVAIHGIGDQYRYATIQSVARQVTRFCGHPIGWPLGYFHLSKYMTVAREYTPPEDPYNMGDVRFGEIFWADIHRRAAKTEDTIEEEKAWARTVVERLRAIDETGDDPLPAPSTMEKLRATIVRATSAPDDTRQSPSNRIDYRKTAAVMEEIIETLATLENLTALADKAGWFHFDLNTILTDFIGTVQVVAEFKDYRQDILNHFRFVMDGLMKEGTEPDEIHIVAHSEGTVVALKMLMELFADPNMSKETPWAGKIKGLMTFGSPLNKHFVMWPDLWKRYPATDSPNLQPAAENLRAPKDAIRWYNYYDLGDPVGFDLNITRNWLTTNKWLTIGGNPGIFDFGMDNDCGFTRYPFPGEAHNDYWNDPVVFDHYFKYGVLNEAKPPDEPSNKLPSVPLSVVTSWTLPFVLCLGLLATAVYVLYHSVHSYTDPGESMSHVARNVGGLTAMLAGITVLSRIPRLAKRGVWDVRAWCFFAMGCCGFLIMTHAVRRHINTAFGGPELIWPAWFLVSVALGYLSSKISRVFPKWGLRPLTVSASVAAAWVIGRVINAKAHPGAAAAHAAARAHAAAAPHAPLWAIFLAGLAFYFLWTLAALLFDLTFVWHIYIRKNDARDTLDEIRTDYDAELAKGKVSLLDGKRSAVPEPAVVAAG